MTLGFIGCGNMASAIISGILEKEIVKKEEIFASTKSEVSAQKITDALGCSGQRRVVGYAAGLHGGKRRENHFD